MAIAGDVRDPAALERLADEMVAALAAGSTSS